MDDLTLDRSDVTIREVFRAASTTCNLNLDRLRYSEDHLACKYRDRVIWLCSELGYTQAEIADELGRSTGMSSMAIRRAREQREENKWFDPHIDAIVTELES